MSNIPMCPVHGTAMKASKHDPDGFYCSKKVDDGYCDQTAKAAAPPPPPTTTSSQPPPPVQRNGNGGMSQSDKERVTRLALLKAAAAFFATNAKATPGLVLDTAQYWYTWAMHGDADAPAEDVEQTEGSDWYKRTALVTKAMATIPYFEHVKHLLAAMKIMEDAGDIAWGMDDDTVVANLSAYAHRRANEKAAG